MLPGGYSVSSVTALDSCLVENLKKKGGTLVKQLFLAGVAITAVMTGSVFAADMPLKAAPAPVLAYDWSGFYLGGVIGGGWTRTDSSVPGLGVIGTLLNVPVVQTTDSSGFIGGIEGGDRYQFGKLVVGWEADMTWGNMNDTSTTTFSPNNIPAGVFSLSRSISADTKWVGTATSTLGIAHDRWLVYGKAGVAWAKTDYTSNWTGNIVGNGFSAFSGTGSTSGSSQIGWTVGTGVEWAIWNNWSVKVEYDYLDFGNKTVAINGTVLPGVANFPASFGLENTQHINEVKGGLNWHIAPNFW
jgi:outer membrane immunogenic protein